MLFLKLEIPSGNISKSNNNTFLMVTKSLFMSDDDVITHLYALTKIRKSRSFHQKRFKNNILLLWLFVFLCLEKTSK